MLPVITMHDFLHTIIDSFAVSLLVLIIVVVLVKIITILIDVLPRSKPDSPYVLVTGCDSGFGNATALELSRKKMYVFAGCLTQEGVEGLKSQTGFKGMAFLMDVTKKEDVERTKKLIERETKGKGLWAIVNNAGIFKISPIEWQCVADMQRTMDVNLWGAVNVTKTMLPLVKRAHGRIINITSMGGRVLLLNGTSYSMSKYALEAFSDGLRYEMKPWGVSVHIVEPGMFQTNILDQKGLETEWSKIWLNQPDEIRQSYGEAYYKGAMLTTRDLVDKLASKKIHKVVDAVAHAVTSRYPKSRYPVGFDANTLWMVIATLPTPIGDFITNFLAAPVTPAAVKR